ncbi:MAG TPA: hypothetical protein VFQ05_04410 [Candidatus Eisenbacteria bacterium]|nr:hypothetical protein [Candidatus Eisenbacteria bacterium]
MTVEPVIGERVAFGPRRGVWIEAGATGALDPVALEHFESLDRVYRALCSLMFNYVPTSGHPGGSISSGRLVAALLYGGMDYDLSSPERDDADMISYAAGHKALGLYAMWALRNEVARIAAPELLPRDERLQLRLEDLLGFRRNPVHGTSLFSRFRAKALDGHPTPATPFVRLATGASGVGLAASLGLAWAAADVYGADAPRVHIVEGEGGMTPGRVAEALAAAGTASLGNAVLHVDWNQASIDSNRVCRDGTSPGDYVQWTPMELLYLHDWNVVYVPDGLDFRQIFAAQRAAERLDNGQPTAIVYRTVKGWHYGIEGRASHGAGHALCSDGFYRAVAPLGSEAGFPTCDHDATRCGAGARPDILEACYWDALQIVRRAVEERAPMVVALASRLAEARKRLAARGRRPRPGAPAGVEPIFRMADSIAAAIRDSDPTAIGVAVGGDRDRIAAERPARAVPRGGPSPGDVVRPGSRTTLRDELGRVLGLYNHESKGAVVVAAADLLASTSVGRVAEGFPSGYYNQRTNPGSRVLAVGGICEDAMAGMLAGIASFGWHVGAGSSYGAFNAPLGHIAARLHAIGNQARHAVDGAPYRPFFLVCAHAGLKTGEDGPTHADPQALQILQGSFPAGTMITLTPWDPQEIAYLVAAALARRPAVIAPFVTRPPETVLDRAALGLAPAWHAAKGVYLMRAVQGARRDGTVVLQGNGVAYAFVKKTLPLLLGAGIDLDVYYVASAELFDLLPAREREHAFPHARAQEAIGFTDFTLPTMDRWIWSERGRNHTRHPFRAGHFLGSGPGAVVMAEAGLDGESQFQAIRKYLG